MARRNGKAGAGALDIPEVKKGILKKMSESMDGAEMEKMAKAYQALTDAEFGELRNFEEMLGIENRRKNPAYPYTATSTGYIYGSGTITNQV